jgi:hypothetical protein
MSDTASQRPLQSKQRPQQAGEWRKTLRRRWPLYATAIVALLFILAYVDGGEEPVHPIVKEVSPSLLSGTR